MKLITGMLLETDMVEVIGSEALIVIHKMGMTRTEVSIVILPLEGLVTGMEAAVGLCVLGPGFLTGPARMIAQAEEEDSHHLIAIKMYVSTPELC